MTSYRNSMRFNTMRMDADYEGGPFTLEGKVSHRNLKSDRMDS
ncbi:MAG: hypothetical protein QXQ46_05685 [Thermoplasmatales archaeon]